MKKYKLLTQDGYDEQYFLLHEIYDENYLGNSKQTPVKVLVEVFPNDWELVEDDSPLTQEEELYLTDDMYLPIHYRGIKIKQPYYPGDGNLSVHELQVLCNQFKEYIHQQQIIKQNCMKHIVELKFKKKF